MRYWKNEIGFSRMSYEDLFNIFGEKLFNIIRPQILNRDTNFRIIISAKERLLQIIGQIMLCKKNKITCLHWQIGHLMYMLLLEWTLFAVHRPIYYFTCSWNVHIWSCFINVHIWSYFINCLLKLNVYIELFVTFFQIFIRFLFQ